MQPKAKADFNSVEFSDWIRNSLLMCKIVAVNLNRMLLVTKLLLTKFHSAPKILLSGHQPLQSCRKIQKTKDSRCEFFLTTKMS